MKKLLAPFLAAAMLAGLAVAAPRAEATPAIPKAATSSYTFFVCPTALRPQAYTCTRTLRAINILDRTTGTVVSWPVGTSVGLRYWDTKQPGSTCGFDYDPYVQGVWWLGAYNIWHWGVVPDWYLDTGEDIDWQYTYAGTNTWGDGRHYEYDMHAFHHTGQGNCADPSWFYLKNDAP